MRQLVSSGSPYEARIGLSRGVRAGQSIAIAGTAPIGSDGQTAAPTDPGGQARQCLAIVRDALESLGASLSDIVRTRILLTRIENWEAVAAVHQEFFGDIRPVTTVMQVSCFVDPQWLVEIEADAVVE
ncbi:MAG: RidA family protein [Planctomycetota bacterium]